MKLTLSQIRASRIPSVLNMCPTDPRIAQFVNEAQQTMLAWGKWWGSYQRYRICMSAGCITWPRQIAAIETFAVCNTPGTVRNEWFEFVENGYGLLSGTSGNGLQLVDRGQAPTFDDLNGATTKRLKLYCDLSDDAGTILTATGWDQNGIWIRTQNGDGQWIDGEQIAASASGTLSTKYYSHVTGIQKLETNGAVRLYSYDDTGTEVALGYYDWDETSPSYRRSLIPNLENMGVCNNTDADNCTKKVLTVMAKMDHLPVSKDSDYLVLGNLPAFKDMVMAIRARENNDLQRALVMEAGARQKLQDELNHYQGDAPIIALRYQDRATWGAGGIENLT